MTPELEYKLNMMTMANNIIMTKSDGKFLGEFDYLMYIKACDLLASEFRLFTILNDRSIDGLEGNSQQSPQ